MARDLENEQLWWQSQESSPWRGRPLRTSKLHSDTSKPRTENSMMLLRHTELVNRLCLSAIHLGTSNPSDPSLSTPWYNSPVYPRTSSTARSRCSETLSGFDKASLLFDHVLVSLVVWYYLYYYWSYIQFKDSRELEKYPWCWISFFLYSWLVIFLCNQLDCTCKKVIILFGCTICL